MVGQPSTGIWTDILILMEIFDIKKLAIAQPAEAVTPVIDIEHSFIISKDLTIEYS